MPVLPFGDRGTQEYIGAARPDRHAYSLQRVVKTQAKAGEWYGPDRPKWLGESFCP